MGINQELLDILACPVCKVSVDLTQNGDGLKCVSCNRVYPIRDDIPIMLVDEATVEASKEPQS
ncbi:MAG: Trm112 family protein [Acidobacteriota bacterium]|nr:Trm112 family protein [Acidobacteriota bacterium]